MDPLETRVLSLSGSSTEEVRMKSDSPVVVPKIDDIHDVVLLPESGGVEKFPVDRATGRYNLPPVSFPRDQPGGRKARACVDPSHDFGPALAIAPTRPEPAAQNGTCILINQHNVRIRNPWTTARLNNEPADEQNGGADPYDSPLPASDLNDQFEILIAGPIGKIYLVQKAQGAPPSIAELPNLGVEGDIWYHLRGGLVAGSVRCFQKDRVIPMVNVTSLTRG
jgi:hypothetical protein